MKLGLFQRALVIGAVAGAGLLASTPAHALVDVTVQHESGTVNDPNCGDGGDANPMGTESDGTRTVVFHPASGCSMTFYTAVAASFRSIDFKITGHAGTLCGYFVVTGAIQATTGEACNNNASYITATASSSSRGSGYYTVTWRTGSNTASYANAYVDFHVINV